MYGKMEALLLISIGILVNPMIETEHPIVFIWITLTRIANGQIPIAIFHLLLHSVKQYEFFKLLLSFAFCQVNQALCAMTKLSQKCIIITQLL